MPGRVLDGTSADIQRAVGALSGMQYGTVVITLRRGALGVTNDFFVLHDSAGTGLWGLYFDSATDGLAWWTGSGSGTGPVIASTSTDYTIIGRKVSGLSTPRWSVYNHSTGAFSHAPSSGGNDPGTAPGVGGTVRFSWGGGEFFNGRVWAVAAWSNKLPWSADAAGDTAIEASGLPWGLRHWYTAQPDALWAFDQQIVEQPVLDRTGKGANQTARTGTTVTWDTPAGMDFRLPETIRVKAASSSATTAAAQVASGTGTANAPQIKVTPNATEATATGTANNAQSKAAAAAEVATATGTANSATTTVSTSSQAATATGASNNPQVAVKVTAEAATATGVANNATAVTGTLTTASAQAATATGAANNAAVGVKATAEAATSTGTANNPSLGVTVQAGPATSTGTAYDPRIIVTPNAGLASGTGTAHTTTHLVLLTAGVASGTGAALDAINAGAITRGSMSSGTHTTATMSPGTSTAARMSSG